MVWLLPFTLAEPTDNFSLGESEVDDTSELSETFDDSDKAGDGEHWLKSEIENKDELVILP